MSMTCDSFERQKIKGWMINHYFLSFFLFTMWDIVSSCSVFLDCFSLMVRFLDHSSQPRRKKESNRSQYTHQYKHPEEYPVNDHSHILPVLLHLAEKRNSREGHFKFHTTPPFFLPAVSFHPWLIPLEWLIFFIMRQLSSKCHSIFALPLLWKIQGQITEVPLFQRLDRKYNAVIDNGWCQWIQYVYRIIVHISNFSSCSSDTLFFLQ